MPTATSSANVPSTSPFPSPQQTTHGKVAQCGGEQVKQPKLIQPAIYQSESTKSGKIPRVTESRDARTDPITEISSIDPFARGASTTRVCSEWFNKPEVGLPYDVINKRLHQPTNVILRGKPSAGNGLLYAAKSKCEKEPRSEPRWNGN